MGDIVSVDGPGLEYNSHVGLVVQIIPYSVPITDQSHPDEYSCKVELFTETRQATIRAKWLKVISKAKREEA